MKISIVGQAGPLPQHVGQGAGLTRMGNQARGFAGCGEWGREREGGQVRMTQNGAI